MEGSTVVVTEVYALSTAQGSLRTNTASVRDEAKKKKKGKQYKQTSQATGQRDDIQERVINPTTLTAATLALSRSLLQT